MDSSSSSSSSSGSGVCLCERERINGRFPRCRPEIHYLNHQMSDISFDISVETFSSFCFCLKLAFADEKLVQKCVCVYVCVKLLALQFPTNPFHLAFIYTDTQSTSASSLRGDRDVALVAFSQSPKHAPVRICQWNLC